MKKFAWVLPIIFLFVACDGDSPTAPELHANCILQGRITVQTGSFGWIKFLGEIKNIGDRKADFVNITFTMYNSSDDVIDTANTYTTPTDLAPNQVGSFECYTTTDRSSIARWRQVIEWDEF